MQAQQIVSLALQIAKVPGYTSQGGQLLNAILEELAQTGSFDTGAKQSFEFNFNPGLISSDPLIVPASGPYPLPANYLRAIYGDVIWYLLGVPYTMIPIDLAEFDQQVQQAGLQSYPYLWATDMSVSPPVAYIWPPASGSFPVRVRYFSRPADITTPETSTATPWFQQTQYLITRLAADVMQITGDSRRTEFLAEADNLLRKYQQMKDDQSDRAIRVRLDRRRFGTRFSSLPNTKVVGW